MMMNIRLGRMYIRYFDQIFERIGDENLTFVPIKNLISVTKRIMSPSWKQI